MKLFSNWQIIWQKKPAKVSDSLETSKEDCASQQEPTPYSSLLLRTCKEVSLATFIDCYCHEIYSGLGEGTPEEITDAWIDIMSEWGELMRNEDTGYMLSLGNQILSLKVHVSLVESITFVLLKKYDLELVDKLINELGYDGEYPENDRVAFVKQLDRVVSLSKTKVYELSELNDEWDRLRKSDSGEKASEDDFERNILRLSKYQGYRINKYKTTIYEYTHIHNNFIAEITARNKAGDT